MLSIFIIMNSSVKRICIDIKELSKNPIDNIFYEPNEDNIFEGVALIHGSEGTPYVFGNYMFHFTFPENYPLSPPKVKFMTHDGKTRFNPNLYRRGKVCLSILNTWAGEKWSSCQSLSTILLNLQITLNENPYLNEPGLKYNKYCVDSYNEYILYKNIEISILKYLDKTNLHPDFVCFHEEIVNNFSKHYDDIVNLIKDKQSTYKSINIYNMSAHLNYENLRNLLIKCKSTYID